jgi:uncharacterized protein YjiS (DUF1127 family)
MRSSIATRSGASPRNAVAAGRRGLWQFIVAVKRRRQLLRIVDYDDHLLRDIGLTRYDVRAALSEPFWRDPTMRLARRGGDLKRN